MGPIDEAALIAFAREEASRTMGDCSDRGLLTRALAKAYLERRDTLPQVVRRLRESNRRAWDCALEMAEYAEAERLKGEAMQRDERLPTTCPICGSGVRHDLEGTLSTGGKFRPLGSSLAVCLNDACGWRRRFYPRSE